MQEKRKTESMQNLLRMEEVKQSLRESQRSLEERLSTRDRRVAELKKQNEEKKVSLFLTFLIYGFLFVNRLHYKIKS